MDELEKLEEIVNELQDKAVVVEGKKDVRALEALGLNHVIPINGRPLVELIPLLEGKEVVILTDFDSEGRRIAARLRRLLQGYKIRFSPRLRGKLMSLRRNRVEDLRKLASELGQVKKIRGDTHGEISANINKVCDKGLHKGQRRS